MLRSTFKSQLFKRARYLLDESECSLRPHYFITCYTVPVEPYLRRADYNVQYRTYEDQYTLYMHLDNEVSYDTYYEDDVSSETSYETESEVDDCTIGNHVSIGSMYNWH